MKTCATAVLLILVCSSIGFADDCRIVPQPGAPVKIMTYRADYQRGTLGRAGIEHRTVYENASDKQITAIEFGFVSFDIWNEFMDVSGGLAREKLEPQKKGTGEWIIPRVADSFLTGVAYVAKVRFASGEIWRANLEAVIMELKKVEADFDAANLKKRVEK